MAAIETAPGRVVAATGSSEVPAWLGQWLVVTTDGESQFVCPRCGPCEALPNVVSHWAHLEPVQRLLFRGQLAVVGEGPDVDDVVEWLDHLGFPLQERDALRKITPQEFPLDADGWDLATTAETERRRLERLAERAASAATPRDELVTLSAHPVAFVSGPALATLTALREREAAVQTEKHASQPRWLKGSTLSVQGATVRVQCKKCRWGSATLSKEDLIAHVKHAAPVELVLLLGQMEAAMAADPRGPAAREIGAVRDWFIRIACPPRVRHRAVSEVLAFLPRETVPETLNDLDLRRCAVKAESVRVRLLRDLRQARAVPESSLLPDGSNAVLVDHPVDFIRSTARRRLAYYELQLAEIASEAEEVPLARAEADEPVESPVTPAPSGDVDPAPEPAPVEPSVPIGVTRIDALAAAIGATVERSPGRLGGGDVWILSDPRPFVGGTLLALDFGWRRPTPDALRDVIDHLDAEGFLRALVIADDFAPEIHALAWRRPLSLITTDELETLTVAEPATQPAPVLPEMAPVNEEAPQTIPAATEGTVEEDPIEVVPEAPQPVVEAPLAPLVGRLLESARFQEQRAAVGRHAPDADFIRRVIRAAVDYQGSIPWNSFVAALGTTDAGARMRLPVLRRLLNVDGYDVVDPAEAEGLVRVDLELLQTQFGLR